MAEKQITETGSEGASNIEWPDLFAVLERNYKEAYFSIDKAIKMDEEGKTSDAISLYEQGLSMIDRALGIPLSEPAKPDITWEKTLAMTQKLRKTRKEISLRMDTIKTKPDKEAELPPSYEDAMNVKGLKADSIGVGSNGNNFDFNNSSTISEPYVSPSMVYDPLLLANLHVSESENADFKGLDTSQEGNEMKLAKNEEILFRCDNVMLYFIAPDGRVSSTSEPNTLVIARLHDNTCDILNDALLDIVSDLGREKNERHHRKKQKHHKVVRKIHHSKNSKSRKGSSSEDENTFLQVGSWVYPLISDVSPCIRSEQGAFILPDILSDVKGAAVGIIVPEDKHNEVHEMFNTILNDISLSSSTKKGRARRSVASGYSSKLVRGATYLANNLIRGAGTTARFLDSSTPMVIDKINPEMQPKQISPSVQKTVEVAKTVSEKAVNVTEYLATKVGMATSALGRYLSPHIQKQGSRLLTSTTNMGNEEATQTINSVLEAASNTAKGISIIYGGLESAASILARSLSSNTVQIIEYKYGQEAGALTDSAFATVGNIYYTHHNIRVLKPKGFTKAAIRGAGKAILEDYRNSKSDLSPHEEFRGSGPGAGSGFLPSA